MERRTVLDILWKSLLGLSFGLLSDDLDAAKRKTSEKVIKKKPVVNGTSENLEEAIEDYIKECRRIGKISQYERTSWVVYDFTTDKKLVSINEDAPMQAASMIKPLVALAYFHEVANKRLNYDKNSKSMLERSVQKSDNYATNWIMERLGGPKKVHQILKRNYGGILINTSIVEYIPAGGGTYLNMASAHDYSRFLYAMWNDKLPYSKELKRLMGLSKRDRLYDKAKDVPRGTLIYDKTGSTAKLCGDMGILVAKGKDGKQYPYIIVGIIERDDRTNYYSNWISSRGNIIRQVSNVTYRYMKRIHNLI